MAYDANLVLQALVTKTATFTGASLDLKTGTPRRGLKARLIIPTAGTGTSPTLDVKIQHSADNTTFTDLAIFGQQTTAVAEDWKTVETSNRYLRALATIGGTAPSFVYQIDVGIARP